MSEAVKYAALLRGINVGGKKKVPMAELREVLQGLGYEDVRTYLQSGNAVFSAPRRDTAALARELEQAIEGRFGFPVAVQLVDGAFLRDVVEACPFPADELEGRQLHATFCSEQPEQSRFAGIDAPSFLPEEFRVGDRVLYLYAPDGLGRSKLAEALYKPAVFKGINVTTRNWNTVVKLAEMTQDRP